MAGKSGKCPTFGHPQVGWRAYSHERLGGVG